MSSPLLEEQALLGMIPQEPSTSEVYAGFMRHFVLRHGIRTIPERRGFCPHRATEKVLALLRWVAFGWPLLKRRARQYIGSAIKVQRWIRSHVQERRRNFAEILRHWIVVDAGLKKALQAQLYKQILLRREQSRAVVRDYAKLHLPENQMRLAVATLYAEKRKRFVREFRQWLRALQAARVERASLASQLACFDGCAGSRLPAYQRVQELNEDITKRVAGQPRFQYTVDTVSTSELAEVVCRRRKSSSALLPRLGSRSAEPWTPSSPPSSGPLAAEFLCPEPLSLDLGARPRPPESSIACSPASSPATICEDTRHGECPHGDFRGERHLPRPGVRPLRGPASRSLLRPREPTSLTSPSPPQGKENLPLQRVASPPTQSSFAGGPHGSKPSPRQPDLIAMSSCIASWDLTTARARGPQLSLLLSASRDAGGDRLFPQGRPSGCLRVAETSGRPLTPVTSPLRQNSHAT
eukprot:RCo015562